MEQIEAEEEEEERDTQLLKLALGVWVFWCLVGGIICCETFRLLEGRLENQKCVTDSCVIECMCVYLYVYVKERWLMMCGSCL